MEHLPGYRQTITDARASLDHFRMHLPDDGTARLHACVKVEIRNEGNHARMWLCNVRKLGRDFSACIFELPPNFESYKVGDELIVSPEDLLDWSVLEEGGMLRGGYSDRLYRGTLTPAEQVHFDKLKHVTGYHELP